MATDQTNGLPHWIEVLKHRWPTALGLAIGILTVIDLRVDAAFVSSISALIVLIALVYLGSAILNSRRFAWVVVLFGLPVVFLFPTSSPVSAPLILVSIALAFVVVGAARGRLRTPGSFYLQTVGMFVFGLIALVALYVDATIGAYLVAFALLGHAAWDALHYLRDRVVVRSYAEFCVFVDLVIGGTILFYLAS